MCWFIYIMFALICAAILFAAYALVILEREKFRGRESAEKAPLYLVTTAEHGQWALKKKFIITLFPSVLWDYLHVAYYSSRELAEKDLEHLTQKLGK